MGKNIFGAGLVACDHIFLKKQQGEDPKYLGSSGGGSVGNTLCLLSLLGYDCKIFGTVGNNSVANIIRSDFELFGISNSLLSRRGGSNKFVKSRQYSHIINEYKGTHDYKRKCLSCGSKFTRDFQIAKRDITNQVVRSIRNADLIHLDRANNLLLDLISEHANPDCPISIDLGYVMFRRDKIVNDILKKATLAKVNKKVFEHITSKERDEALQIWREYFPQMKTLVVTDGENGLFGYSRLNSGIFKYDMESIPCDYFRDASGAGDILMAILISQLIFKKTKSKEMVVDSIKRGQALASLNCTLYGARALQRIFFRQDTRGKDIFSYAEEILEDGKVGKYFSPSMGIPKSHDYIFRFDPDSVCSICGIPKKSRRKKSKPKRKSVYIANLSQSLMPMTSAFENSLSRRKEFEDIRGTPVLFIGSGGSLSAGIFGEQLILKSFGIPAKAVPPYTFENIDPLKSETPVCLLSYGGNNPDILGASLRVLKTELKNCLVLSGNKDSPLYKISNKNNWSFVELPGQEKRSFVSTVGMLAQISSIAALFASDDDIEALSEFFDFDNLKDIIQRAEEIAKENSELIDKTTNNLHLVCVASGWGIPALADFESKIVEGGVCTIEIAEMKNYTHGRYLNTFYYKDNRAMIIFETPEDKELSKFLQKKFRRYIHPTIVLKTEEQGVVGGLELMLKSLYLAWHIGKRKGRDIGNPYRTFPPQARGLYGWTPKYRKGKKFQKLADI